MPRSLETVLTLINGSRDAVTPSIQSFPPLNVEQIASELGIESRARNQGADDRPAADAATPDTEELAIGEEIERRARKAAEE